MEPACRSEQCPRRRPAPPAPLMQLGAVALQAVGSRTLESGPEPGQLEARLNRRQSLCSLLVEKLAELKGQFDQRGLLKIEARSARSDLRRQRKVFQKQVALDTAPCDTPRHALGPVPGEPVVWLFGASIDGDEDEFIEWNQTTLDWASGEIA